MMYFSLDRNVDISAGRYPEDVLCLGNFESDEFQLRSVVEEKERLHTLTAGTVMLVREDTLYGVRTGEEFIYTKAVPGRDITMNEQIRVGKVFRLSDLLPYGRGSIVNMDIVPNPNMKFAVMAFDMGTGLSERSAPGDALISALEGEGEVVYENAPHNLKTGNQFRMAKDGWHGTKANGQFKMMLLLTLT